MDEVAALEHLNARLGRSRPGLVDSVRAGVSLGALESMSRRARALGLESIVLRRMRPVLAVTDGRAVLSFPAVEDGVVWRAPLTRAAAVLQRSIPSVGRIQVGPHGIGTGWLVDDGLIVTNRHVARAFSVSDGDGWRFLVPAEIDFLAEVDRSTALRFPLVRVVHVEESGPDVALIQVDLKGDRRGRGVPLECGGAVRPGMPVAVIGFPYRDDRVPERALMKCIFGDVYGRKRLAPGEVTAVQGTDILHDAATLGGNSGSLVLDLATGCAVGLHYRGRFEVANYAVRGDAVDQIIATWRARSRVRRPKEDPLMSRSDNDGSVSITIPLTVTLSLGTPGRSVTHVRVDGGSDPSGPSRELHVGDIGDDDMVEPDGLERSPTDYVDRGGYRPDFLGQGPDVPLPVPPGDVLPVGDDATGELKYFNFSVVMHAGRRQCHYSAVNIDGLASKKGTRRRSWRYDPRIDEADQIKNECYGNPPKFSRGHMTRREDPAWGDMSQAQLGSDDSMHVTNAVPQMQSFNSPIWLELENYALEHARRDDMRITVMTGPVFDKADPEYYGVRVPLRFWKIIAFVHDDTKELTSAAYEMDQSQTLPPRPDDEFVYGAFTSHRQGEMVQVPVASIEAKTGLDFGPLRERDVLGDEESTPRPILRADQLVWSRAADGR